ncbi:hypothetical protein [Gulosibacter sp. ACHW.36C]|uniref:Uncharacterized protein n=1 Tax=Gulosibacter sediminis TaxID=1729695 RepID=A0ABY4MYW4_9MICO|nr:hypothetical protein [Gulosibacter sediminis]UQN15267.1 hypothetical protein M3M28_01995 [Gulosibacter sediminis]
MFGWFRKLAGLGEPQADSAQTAPAPQAEPTSPSQAPVSMPEQWAQPRVAAPLQAAAPQPTPEARAVVTTPADYVVPEPPTVAVPEHRVEAPAAAASPPAEVAPAPAAEVAPVEAPVEAPSFEVAELDSIDEDDYEEPEATEVEAESEEPRYAGLIPTPSGRPAMPLSAHPNFAGLGLAPAPQHPPRMLQPEAALTTEAQLELLRLFDDLFGPRGRYRLEWRTGRDPGDDAVFSEIMSADLVRRVQNTIADVAELERPEPLRAIEPARPANDAGDDELKRAS